jgi:cytochrome c-type biogenesis protein CcmH
MARARCGRRAGQTARALAALGFSALLLAAPVAAEPAAAESSWGYALADELMSPWCPGFALPDCASGYATELRLWILEQERLGRAEGEVRDELLARYGEEMLQAPRAEGRGVLAYAIPAAIILSGLGVLVAFLRKQGAGRAPGGVANPARNAAAWAGASGSDAALARVDAELAQYESARD